MRFYLRIFIVLCFVGAGTARAGELSGRTFTLDNGMEITLIENHANP